MLLSAVARSLVITHDTVTLACRVSFFITLFLDPRSKASLRACNFQNGNGSPPQAARPSRPPLDTVEEATATLQGQEHEQRDKPKRALINAFLRALPQNLKESACF